MDNGRRKEEDNAQKHMARRYKLERKPKPRVKGQDVLNSARYTDKIK